MEKFAARIYRPLLDRALQHRYTTLSLFIFAAMVLFTLLVSNRILFVFFPRVESERATASLTMPLGTPEEVTGRHIKHIEAIARQLQDELIDPATGESIIMDVMAVTGGQGVTGGRGRGQSGVSSVGEVSIQTVAPENRELKTGTMAIVQDWRRRIGNSCR